MQSVDWSTESSLPCDGGNKGQTKYLQILKLLLDNKREESELILFFKRSAAFFFFVEFIGRLH